jgi:hypothetical protein
MTEINPTNRKRKTASAQNGEGAFRGVDDLVLESWNRRCDFQSDQIAELTRTVRGFNGTPGLVERLARIETVMAQQVATLAEQKTMLSEMHGMLTGLAVAKPEPAAVETPKKAEEAQVVTKGALALMAVDFGKTIVMAVVVWALLTLGPELMGHLWGP